MAVRSNIGNITTNALQIASVGATTASGVVRRVIGDASSPLNALSKSERKALKETEVQKLRDEPERYVQEKERRELNPHTYAVAPNKEEAREVGGGIYERMKNSVLGKKEDSEEIEIKKAIDSINSLNNSPQSEEITANEENNLDWLYKWKNRKVKSLDEEIAEFDKLGGK